MNIFCLEYKVRIGRMGERYRRRTGCHRRTGDGDINEAGDAGELFSLCRPLPDSGGWVSVLIQRPLSTAA